MKKCRAQLASGNVLVRYKAKQVIGILAEGERLNEFDLDLYFALVEKVTVHSENRLTIHLFDGTEVGCDIE